MLQSMKVSLNGIPILDSVQIFLLLSNGKLAFGVGEQENAHLEKKKFAMKTLRGENKTKQTKQTNSSNDKTTFLTTVH